MWHRCQVSTHIHKCVWKSELFGQREEVDVGKTMLHDSVTNRVTSMLSVGILEKKNIMLGARVFDWLLDGKAQHFGQLVLVSETWDLGTTETF